LIIVFKGKILKDEQTLAECNVDNASTVHLVKGKTAAASGSAGAGASTGVGTGAGAAGASGAAG
jgi:hypothetical protein